MSGGDAEQLLRSMTTINKVERLIDSLTDVYKALQSFTGRRKLYRPLLAPSYSQGEISSIALL